jgi:hypothetical protein
VTLLEQVATCTLGCLSTSTPTPTLALFPRGPSPSGIQSDALVANRTVRVWHEGDRERLLNEGQLPDSRGVRVALGTGYRRVRGIGRAWRNGRGTSSPTQKSNRFTMGAHHGGVGAHLLPKSNRFTMGAHHGGVGALAAAAQQQQPIRACARCGVHPCDGSLPLRLYVHPLVWLGSGVQGPHVV